MWIAINEIPIKNNPIMFQVGMSPIEKEVIKEFS